MKEHQSMDGRISLSNVMVTPEMAADILRNHNHRNRVLSERHVGNLLGEMRAGRWRYTAEAIRFDRDGELIDGQHRMAALARYGKPLVFLTARGFERDAVYTTDQGRRRTLADMMKFDGVTSPNCVAAVINKYFTIKAGGVFMNSERHGDGGKGRHSQSSKWNYSMKEKIDEYKSSPDLYDRIALYAHRCYEASNLLLVSEVGGTYAYLLKDKMHPEERIRGFFDSLCITGGGPAAVTLLRNALTRDRGSYKPMTGLIKSGLLKKAWNFYATGKEMKRLRYVPEKEGDIDFV